jgi:hypothetical protein
LSGSNLGAAVPVARRRIASAKKDPTFRRPISDKFDTNPITGDKPIVSCGSLRGSPHMGAAHHELARGGKTGIAPLSA